MFNKIHIGKDHILLLAIVLLSSLVILLFSTQKINYHIDELLTYNLANSTGYLNIVPGEKYEPYGPHQEKYLTPTTRFDYKNVWKNQANDVHPPFYYALVHTISSFIPNVVSKYIGISANMIFNALIILLLFKFTLLLTNNKTMAYITSLFWAVNPGIMSDMMFIRMYIMTMFFCLLISYVHIKYMDIESNKYYKFYLSLFFVSVAGILTHYYFLIFTFFICAIFCFYLLFRKKIKELLMYIGTYIVTFLTTFLIFPSIYDHILSGERGKESFENFTNLNEYLQTAAVFFKMININQFGGFLWLIITFIILSFIIQLLLIKSSNRIIEKGFILKSVYLLFACTMFFLLITNISVYLAERYIQPIFPVLILVIVVLLFHAITLFLSKKKALLTVSIILSLVSINGYVHSTSYYYFISESEKAIEVAEQHKDEHAIYLYDRTWKIFTNYVELANYKSVTFYDINNLESFYEDTTYDHFVLYIHSKDESVIQSIVEKLPTIESYKNLNYYAYSQVYYME